MNGLFEFLLHLVFVAEPLMAGGESEIGRGLAVNVAGGLESFEGLLQNRDGRSGGRFVALVELNSVGVGLLGTDAYIVARLCGPQIADADFVFAGERGFVEAAYVDSICSGYRCDGGNILGAERGVQAVHLRDFFAIGTADSDNDVDPPLIGYDVYEVSGVKFDAVRARVSAFQRLLHRLINCERADLWRGLLDARSAACSDRGRKRA